jgi:protein subunit release factor A
MKEAGMAIDPKDIKIECIADRPKSGMWHTGPNNSWIRVTHLPTMISATMFDDQQHRARDAAMTCVEMMVEQSRLDKCWYPENLKETVATNDADKERS